MRDAVGSIPTPATSIARPIPELDSYSVDRFWRLVKRAGREDCWNWTGGKCNRGYGRFKLDGRLYGAHRIAYTLKLGLIPTEGSYHGALVMHSCDNPSCCNPAHLSLGSSRDNVRDMAAKGRLPRQRTIFDILPKDTIRAICETQVSANELSRRIGIQPHVIGRVRRRFGVPTQIYKHLHKIRPAAEIGDE